MVCFYSCSEDCYYIQYHGIRRLASSFAVRTSASWAGLAGCDRSAEALRRPLLPKSGGAGKAGGLSRAFPQMGQGMIESRDAAAEVATSDQLLRGIRNQTAAHAQAANALRQVCPHLGRLTLSPMASVRLGRALHLWDRRLAPGDRREPRHSVVRRLLRRPPRPASLLPSHPPPAGKAARLVQQRERATG